MNRQVLTIEDVCLRVTSGGTPSRRVSAFFKGDIPWLKTQELRDTWVYETEEHITRDAVNQSSAKLLPAHSVMMAMYGATAGKLAILGSEMTCNQAACAMVVDPDKADYRYLYYSLLNDRARIVDRANGAAQQNLSARAIKALEYSFPPIEEQRVIAATLGALDDKIESNRRASKLAQELLRARFRAWFTEYLPWGGKRPVDWREGKLRDVVDLVRTPTKPGCYPQRPYVPIDTIPMDSLGLSHSRDNSEAKSSLFTFEADDILLGAMRVYFHRVALAPYAGITRNTTFVLRPKSRSHLAFALLTLDDDATIAHANATSKGSTMPYAVWDGALAEMPLFIPPEETIERFENECAPLVELVRDQLFQSTKLQTLRDALLPDLVSGRIRVLAEEGAA